MNTYTEFPVFPMITYRDHDSPVEEGIHWLEIVSIPRGKLKKPPTQSAKSAVFRVGDWLVVVWPKAENLTGREANEITMYEASKGSLPESIEELGEARTRALWRQGWATLIEINLEIDMESRGRYSGAIVEGSNSIQVWLRL